MTEILLIRHGETAWNAVRRLQGHLDVPLNDEGLRQATALGHALRDEGLEAIWSSDLQRARQTAQPIADACNLPVHPDPRLRERCYGGFEGLLYDELATRHPAEYAAWKARELDAPLPPGERMPETLRGFFERATGAIADLVDGCGLRKVALVTHGGVLECAYRAAQGRLFDAPRDFDILNASINRLTWDGQRLQILSWGEVAHLRDVRTLDEVDR